MSCSDEEFKIDITQGSTYRVEMAWDEDGSPVDLTGYGIFIDLKKKSSDEVAKFTLSTENTRINIIDAASGKFELIINRSDTESIEVCSGVYDIAFKSPANEVVRPFRGTFSVSEGITDVL